MTEENKFIAINKDGIVESVILSDNGEVLESKKITKLDTNDFLKFEMKFPYWFSQPIPFSDFKMPPKDSNFDLPTLGEYLFISYIEQQLAKIKINLRGE